MKFGIFTNGYYEVFGIIYSRWIYGICVKSEYLFVKAKWEYVNWPEYHLETDVKSQFWKRNK